MAYRKVKRLLLLFLIVILLVLFHHLLSYCHKCFSISSFRINRAILKREGQDPFDLKIYGDVCSQSVLEKDPYYRTVMKSYLDVWHKFVPHQSNMTPSNCWYVENMSALPGNLTKKIRSLQDCKHLNQKFTLDERKIITSKILGNDSRAIFSTNASSTGHHFCLPDVNVMGFTKTASTLLYEYFCAHPLLAKPFAKEMRFWREMMASNDDEHRKLLILAYLYDFFDASSQIKHNSNMFTIDAAVSDVFATVTPIQKPEVDICIVPLLLSKTMPRTKLLALVRNPISRLWSEFIFFCSPDKWDQQESLKQLEKSPRVVASVFHNYTVTALQEFKMCIQSGRSEFHCTALAGSYSATLSTCKRVRLGISMYYVHLVKWFNVFPREQIHVIRLDDLASDPSGTMKEVWRFLGKPFDAEFKPIQKKVNANEWNRMSNGVEFEMFPETRTLLNEFFQPYNVKLAELLGSKQYLWNK